MSLENIENNQKEKNEQNNSEENIENRKSKKFFKLSNFLYIIMFVFLFIFTMFFHQKYMISYVPTESMYPTIEKGSLCISQRNPESYNVGDIAIYDRGDILVIHRIVGIEGDKYIFKGDNNTIKDKPVEKEQLLAKTITYSKKWGVAYKVIQNNFIYIVLLIFILFYLIPTIIKFLIKIFFLKF